MATKSAMRCLLSLRSLFSTPRITTHSSCPSRRAPVIPRTRAFSASAPQRIMEMTGFTEEQLTVRDAIQKICANFPNEYWQEHDQTETDPKELHAALAQDGWLGIALPEELGGAGLGISEATMMMQTITQSGAGMA